MPPSRSEPVSVVGSSGFGERLADFIAAFGGSWKFIILFGLSLAGWIITLKCSTVKPVIIAIVVQALWGLGKTAIKGTLLGAVVVAAIAMSFLELSCSESS